MEETIGVQTGLDNPTVADVPQFVQQLWHAAKWLENVSVHGDTEVTAEAARLAIRWTRHHLDEAEKMLVKERSQAGGQ